MSNYLKTLGAAFLMLSVASCSSVTAVSDYCVITNPQTLSTEDLAVYDCLCSADPIDKDCR